MRDKVTAFLDSTGIRFLSLFGIDLITLAVVFIFIGQRNAQFDEFVNRVQKVETRMEKLENNSLEGRSGAATRLAVLEAQFIATDARLLRIESKLDKALEGR